MRLKRIVVGLLLLGLITASIIPAAAAEALNTDKELLQKGLTVYEIDKELSRIADKQAQLAQRLQATEQQIAAADRDAKEARRHAAGVIRAYYMGDRDSLWVLIFSIRSLSDALSLWEYTQMIVRSDQNALKSHTEAWKRLTGLQAQIQQAQQELKDAKDRYTNEKARLTMLQQEVDRQLSASANADSLQKQMQDLNRLWRDRGIPLFKTYFQALASAMKQLPEIVSMPASAQGGSKPEKSGNLIMNGLNYTFQLSDSELNDFLRQKNELFRNLTFQFTEQQVVASGRHDNLDIQIKGSYRLAVKDDGKNKPYIRFQMEELTFNGFSLPQTTVEDMENQFDLGIYPQLVTPFLQATGVKLQDHLLSIYLKLGL
ncbi:hypothetical protein O9H85_01880 [Paenibacillus filicis]|uniref:SbsC C-terminal domain-containing protein n=1 Tax=Paenibacillus gyeongsangnamensis TaxID=3388067 RepID=A0ABT4Q362_9BACL|nr:hypothetical protein [Paenibacillus filicis]MCZ8511207.1 hypothetical protein [Paenibacillus filicis]